MLSAMDLSYNNGSSLLIFFILSLFTHVQEQTAEVRRYFGCQHSIESTCALGHTTVVPIGEPQILFPINPFDWREIQRKKGSKCSLSDYLASATPRVLIGNAEGGTTPVHDFPLACSQNNCRQHIDPLTARIESAWPQILQISPDRSAACPIPPRISIPTGAPEGGNVEYVLVGITSFEWDQHWISNIRIDDELFRYDDLFHYGRLHKTRTIAETDGETVLLNYCRTSKSCIVSFVVIFELMLNIIS